MAHKVIFVSACRFTLSKFREICVAVFHPNEALAIGRSSFSQQFLHYYLKVQR
jgi:hypothetical protein